MRKPVVAAILILGANLYSVTAADRPGPRPAAELPEIKELPNPFTFADGSPVRDKDDWPRRRGELKDLFQDYEYGHLPPRPQKATVLRAEPVTDKENGVVIQDLEVKLEQGDRRLTAHVRLARSRDARQPVPVVIQSRFSFGRPGVQPSTPSGKPYAAFTRRGYAVAECDFQEFAPDRRDGARTAGVYRLFGDRIDCGALMAWAWGVHRVVDVLESVDQIDPKKVIVTGHSRYGKAALLAGAFDERIALTAPSHSGCAGVAPYRFIFGRSEQLHNVVGAFPYWFHPGFDQFVGNVERLPVDQHLLQALVAPRALLDTEGTQDPWTNPEGAQLTHVAARKVYDFLGAGDNLGIRYRPVGHVPSINDLLDFADHVFFKKPLPGEFGKLPYRMETRGFSWDVPK